MCSAIYKQLLILVACSREVWCSVSDSEASLVDASCIVHRVNVGASNLLAHGTQ